MPYVTKQYQAVLQCVQSRGADAFTAAELTRGPAAHGPPGGPCPRCTVSWKSWRLPAWFTRSPQRRVRCTSAAPTLSRTRLHLAAM